MTPASPEDSAGVRAVGRFEWEHLLRRIRMPKTVKYVAFVTATYADPDGTRVRPGAAELAAATEQSDSSVRRATATLAEWGFLGLVSRGGGRGGKGKASEYRLTLPTDLLERFELLPPGGASARRAMAIVRTESPVTQMTAQSPESPVTLVTSQSAPSPVDNSDSPVAQVTAETVAGTPNDRSQGTGHGRMGGQNLGMGGHPGDQLPATRPATKDDQPLGHHPAQLTTARTIDENPIDLAAADEHPLPRPAKCRHGLAAHIRPEDGLPTCPLCRREDAEEPP